MKRLEDQLQRAVVELLTIYEHQDKLRFFAVPNGGKRNKVEAAIMKGLGVRAGVPDLCVLITDGPALFIELKAPKGCATESQVDWSDWLNMNGHASIFARTVETVQMFVDKAIQERRAA